MGLAGSTCFHGLVLPMGRCEIILSLACDQAIQDTAWLHHTNAPTRAHVGCKVATQAPWQTTTELTWV